jgi:hypothetical protein
VAVDLLLEAIKAPDQRMEGGELNCAVFDVELRIGESSARPTRCAADCEKQQILPSPGSLESRESAA